MTKADLIDEVCQSAEMTRHESTIIVDTIFNSIVQALRADDKIEVRGFGTLRNRMRQPRTGRNPKTGAAVEVPAKRIPYFKPSRDITGVLNNSSAGDPPKKT